MLIIGFLALACVCLVILMVLVGPQNLGEYAIEPPPPASDGFDIATPVPQEPTPPPEPFVAPSIGEDGQTWLVMLYQDADDKILEHDIYLDLNEVERVGSSDQVHIVTQIDRFSAGYPGDGDWSSAKRFYVTQDNDLERVNSQFVADLERS